MTEPPFVLRAFVPAGTTTFTCTCVSDEVTDAEHYLTGQLHQVDCHITRTLQVAK